MSFPPFRHTLHTSLFTPHASLFTLHASRFTLNDEHRVTICSKPVLFFYCQFIAFEKKFIACKSSYHHKQRRKRKVKIRNHHVGDFKIIGWKNKFIGPAIERF